MSSDDFGPDEPENVFDHLSLTKAQLARIDAARTRRRDMSNLVADVFFFAACYSGTSRKINHRAREGIRCEIDNLKLAIAATPAQTEVALWSKLAALDQRDPMVESNANMRPMLEAAVRADIARLKVSRPGRWFLDWSLS